MMAVSNWNGSTTLQGLIHGGAVDDDVSICTIW